ncbi:hypothetical protein A3D06_00140 [Candidatus Roizmanbacteria bacterium RIFCSPHIGHO2_02_FULL_40_9]|uniref:Metallo-beta-lactamase domain-containing protein n=1 Tax=Candidatus Roizmanbacteria bacterium RIFCSPHIGHO2_02_FULL_40_9 TaxID=1802042 RepID=A0A1F7HC94_9BACT|nr:MAG: hypothetical protein A3D06_00140 [Candidatus Roizmanbacteria bacterium RIFCSPHIGHO2_02_FULL_40_9]
MSNFKNFLFIYVLLCISGVIIALYCGYSAAQRSTEIVFCDVGQGDGAYIRTQNHIDILIDAGPDEKILDCLHNNMPFFDNHIEFVFVSHLQKDHYGGLQYVGEQYTFGNIFVTQMLTESKDLFEGIIKNKYRGIETINEKSLISIDEKTFFKVFWPSENLKNQPDPNMLSHIMLFEDNGLSVIFTGDAQPITLSYVEDQLKSYLKEHSIRIEILKVPHHGSLNGLTENFLTSVSPEIGIISSGKHNSYGHPSKRILEMLNVHNVSVFNTVETSSIKTYIKGRRLVVEFLGRSHLYGVF